MRLSCGPQRFDTRDILLDELSRVPKIYRTLRVQPELRAVPKQPRQAQRHIRTHATALSQQLVDGLSRHAYSFRKLRNRKTVVWEKVLPEHFTRVGRSPIHACVRNAHDRISKLMVVAELNGVCVPVDEAKTYSPLVIY